MSPKVLEKVVIRILVMLGPSMLIIACGLPSSLREPTLEDTIRGLATQMNSESIASTIQAVATRQAEEGISATASSIIKPEEEKLLATIEAFSTREGSQIKATVEAYTALEGKQIASTLQAMVQNEKLPATLEAYLGELKEPFSGENPEDIPLVDSRVINKLVKTPQLITYSTSLSYDEAILFYKTQMPHFGWSRVERGTTELDTITVLKFTKSGSRKATISIYKNILGESTIVLISIEKQ